MKLEEEIKQKNFKNEKQKMVINLLYTGNWIGLKVNKFMKNYGLTLQQYNVLRILNGQYPDPATVHCVAERMLDKTSNASRIVDKLVKKKFAERKECQKDRRLVDIIINEKGKNLLNKIEIELEKWYKQFDFLTKTEVKKLNQLLDKIRN